MKHSLPVDGIIPSCINDVYLHNDANPLFEPVVGHHLFDGDGMVHAVSINNSDANCTCRFTETQRLLQEKELGRLVFPKAIGKLHGHSGIARMMLFYVRDDPRPTCCVQAARDDHRRILEVINGDKDFLGIEILAASDSICNEVTEYDGNPLVEETQKKIQSSASSTHLEETTASLEASGCFPKDSINESKSEGPSLQDDSFAVLHEFSCDKDITPERPLLLLDDRLLWDLNVSMDAWPCDGGTVDTQKDSFANISVRSEEF
ncbi:hypothetical protein V6N13_040752 [Hibiscus sabdariffa]|uniref:Uncharacterized protein n=1 Tax=Hibiscus sabdariffa TaxID=183260 RepID=A0ABR2R9T1_9ROSI